MEIERLEGKYSGSYGGYCHVARVTFESLDEIDAVFSNTRLFSRPFQTFLWSQLITPINPYGFREEDYPIHWNIGEQNLGNALGMLVAHSLREPESVEAKVASTITSYFDELVIQEAAVQET